MIETEDGYQFRSGYKAAALSSDTRTVRSHYHGIHGYYPDTDGYRTMTWFYGQDVAPSRSRKCASRTFFPPCWSGCRYLLGTWMARPFPVFGNDKRSGRAKALPLLYQAKRDGIRNSTAAHKSAARAAHVRSCLSSTSASGSSFKASVIPLCARRFGTDLTAGGNSLNPSRLR